MLSIFAFAIEMEMTACLGNLQKAKYNFSNHKLNVEQCYSDLFRLF